MLTLVLVALLATFAATQLSSYSTTIYLHRAMAHKGLKLHPVVSFLMQAQLWLMTGIVAREWVAVHRKHHHFTDEDGDPHSPYLKGLWKVLLWNAVYYAREANKSDVIEKYTKDMPHTRTEAIMSRGWTGLAFGIAIFMGGFWYFVPNWVGLVTGATVFVAQGMAYIGLGAIINGACHVLGYRNFRNTATNIRIVALFSGGEGLHNNHHQYPAASKFSMNRNKFEVDPAWLVIKVLEWLRLAKPLPLPKPELA